MKLNSNRRGRSDSLSGLLAVILFCASAALLASTFNAPPTSPHTLGNYPDTSIPLSTNTTITPDAVPTNTTSINVSTSTTFNGRLEGDPATGVVRITDAHPAGAYTVTVRAFNGASLTATKTFTLTVITPVTCAPVTFTAASNYCAEDNPEKLAVGDFNDDGKQDIAVANVSFFSAGTFSILLGDGAGHFQAPISFPAGTDVNSLAIGDFNGDGEQDIVVANGGGVSVSFGDGTGHFSAPANFDTGSSSSVAVGDFNGDGKQDLAVTKDALDNVSIVLGDGAGSFGTPTNFTVADLPTGIAIADFNSDGKQDLVVTNNGSDNISILLGDGSGSSSGPTNYAVGDTPYSPAIGDFNGDGRQDIVVSNYLAHTISILLGDGTGHFAAAADFTILNAAFKVVVGDFNGDGFQDIATGNDRGTILLGTGTGTFGSPIALFNASNTYSVTLGDFNGDGMQDLAFGHASFSPTSSIVGIMLRTCPGATPTPTATATGTPPPAPVIGNYPDRSILLSANTTVLPDAPPANTTSISVFTSTNFRGKLEGDPITGAILVTDAHPAGTYMITVEAFNGAISTTIRTFALIVTTPPICNPLSFIETNLPVGAAADFMTVGDFNADGNQDLATANGDTSNVSILLGNGAGQFSAPITFVVGNNPRSLAVGDFNGDGRQDLAVANAPSECMGSVSILLGDGTGHFISTANLTATASSFPRSVAVGDFNGDGKQDLAVANSGSGNVSIFPGHGTGQFGSARTFAAGTDPYSIAAGDFNGDGKQDLAAANYTSSSVSILLGAGAGNFGAPTNLGAGTFPYSIAVGDFNGDGKQDLAVVNNGSNSISIFMGDGAGHFATPLNLLADCGPYSVATGDFNGDTKQDLAAVSTGCNGTSTTSIYLGNGAGNFNSPTMFPAGNDCRSLAVGDFNEDGKQDIAVANHGVTNASILIRSCAPTPTATPTATTTISPCPAIITQSTSQAITVTSTLCSNPPPHPFLYDNHFWRAFNMQSFVGGAEYTVNSVSFGVQSVVGTPMLTLRLYANNGGPFPQGTRTQIGTSTVTVTSAQNGTVVTTPLAAVVPTGTFELVMELFISQSTSGGFGVGANTASETGPSYWSCMNDVPQMINSHLVFNVNGTCTGPPPTPGATPSCTPLDEGFQDITTLPATGWAQINRSSGGGATSWFQGNTTRFPAQSGASNSYIEADFNSTFGTNTISNWLLTPAVMLGNGATLTFFTRTVDTPSFPDRLQVRMSTNGASSNVGSSATSVGDFSTLLLDINPTYTLTGYPSVWTEFTITMTGIPSPTFGRLAFRYFVENGGPKGDNSDYIGIDTVQFSPACGPLPTPSVTPSPTPTATLTATATPTGTATPTATPGPDKIVFGTNRDVIPGDGSNFDIYVMNDNGTNQIRLTTDQAYDLFPRWSPDRSRIVFTRESPGTNAVIYIMNANGSNQVPLTTNLANNLAPAWSPDGSKIVFMSDGNGGFQYHIFVMNADGSNPIPLTNGPAGDTEPCWSPDGTKIVFASPRSGNYDIYLMDADGGNQISLTNNPNSDIDPAWSPDGTKIVYASGSNGQDDYHYEIYVMNADGSNKTRLTNFAGAVKRGPSWSRDGRRIVFSNDRRNNSNDDIYVMNADGSNPIRLTTTPAVDNVPDWGIAALGAPSPTPTSTASPTPGPATHFDVVVFPPDVIQFIPFPFTVTARDQFNNVATGYTGTVHFTSSDTGSGTQLPNNSILTNGTGIFTATLTIPNYQTITATDTVNSSITGTSTQILVFPNPGTPTPSPSSTPTATATLTPCIGTVVWSENFDGVTAPALPTGWVATNPDPGDGTQWVTSTTTPDTPPNAAFIPDQDGISDKVLDSPPITIPTAVSVLRFRNNFDTEFSSGIFCDGGVLEVSSPNISGGDFLDITDFHVGGNFVSGGYTGDISCVLAGRMGWVGNSGGYINTVINLGPNLAGQTITLRFRFVSDEAVAAPGWRVDTITITDGVCPTPTPTPSPSPTPTPAPLELKNLSTRMRVETGNNVLIGGFIITGVVPRTLVVRAIGPSLSQFGIPDVLADPTLALYDNTGVLEAANDNWQDDPEAGQLSTLGLVPGDPAESAFLRTILPGTHTAIVAGKDGGTGVGLVEIYDVTSSIPELTTGRVRPIRHWTDSLGRTGGPIAQLGNISTRGFVGTGGNVLIGGLILSGPSANAGIAIRGIGPSLAILGLPDVLQDPTLELRDSNGVLLVANDNWEDDPASAAQLTAHGLALPWTNESGIYISLEPSLYTAILAGKNGGVGVGLVEIYNLQ